MKPHSFGGLALAAQNASVPGVSDRQRVAQSSSLSCSVFQASLHVLRFHIGKECSDALHNTLAVQLVHGSSDCRHYRVQVADCDPMDN